MRFLSHLSMAVALATAGAVALTAIPEPAAAAKKKKKKKEKPRKVSLTKEFQAAAAPVEAAIKAGDTGAKAAMEQLLAQTWAGDDLDVAGQFAVNLGTALKDQDLQLKGIVARINSGMLIGKDKVNMLYFGGSFSQQAGDHASARKYLTEAIALGYPGAGGHLELFNSYSATKEFAAALGHMDQALKITNNSANMAPESWYKQSRDRARQSNDKQLLLKWSTKWAGAYPSDASWRDASTAYRFANKLDTSQNLELLRFMRSAGTLNKLSDYQEYASEADKKALLGEIVDVVEEGRSKGIVTSNSVVIGEYLNPAKAKVTSDRASLPNGPSNVRGSGSSSVMMNFGDVWFGYGDYAKAITFYQAGKAKAVGAGIDRANISIGTAAVKSGDFTAAKASFDSVSGVRKGLANMWLTWIEQKTRPAPAPAATPPAT